MTSDAALLDDTDRLILNRIQSDFPVTARPYEAIGRELNLPEAEVLERLQRLKQTGIIRRIGGNFSLRNWGLSAPCAPHRCRRTRLTDSPPR